MPGGAGGRHCPPPGALDPAVDQQLAGLMKSAALLERLKEQGDPRALSCDAAPGTGYFLPGDLRQVILWLEGGVWVWV